VIPRSLLRSILAGTVIGLVEAAGLDPRRRHLRRPLRVVRLDDTGRTDPLATAGVWFLDPIGDPRPDPTDRRGKLPWRGALRLTRLPPQGSIRTRN